MKMAPYSEILGSRTTLEQWRPTIITVILAYLITRRIAHPLFARIDKWAQRQPSKAQLDEVQETHKKRHFERQKVAAEEIPPVQQAADTHHALSHFKLRYLQMRKLAAVLIAFIIDVVTFLAAALVGYMVVLALPIANNTQNSTLLSMLFLTAFFTIEMVKTISRAIFSCSC